MSGGPSVRPDLAGFTPYHSARAEGLVKLNANESPFPPPAQMLERLGDEARSLRGNRYPDPDCIELREAIARHTGVSVPQILVGNGSNQVILALVMAYGGSGRRAAQFEPTYTVYSKIAAATATSLDVARRDASFGIADAELERVILAAPEIVIFCSPNNPTGRQEEREQIARAARALPESLVIVDEAYVEMATEDFADLASAEANVVSVRTFSKAFSLAAMRIGYAIGPAGVIAGAAAVALPYPVNALTQRAGVIAFDYAEEMRGRIEALRAERERVYQRMLPMEWVTVYPSEANFLLFSPADADDPAADAQRIWQGLVDRGVLIRDCSAWPGLNGGLRMTIGAPDENDVFLGALGELGG